MPTSTYILELARILLSYVSVYTYRWNSVVLIIFEMHLPSSDPAPSSLLGELYYLSYSCHRLCSSIWSVNRRIHCHWSQLWISRPGGYCCHWCCCGASYGAQMLWKREKIIVS